MSFRIDFHFKGGTTYHVTVQGTPPALLSDGFGELIGIDFIKLSAEPMEEVIGSYKTSKSS